MQKRAIAMLPVSVLNTCCDFVDYSIEVDGICLEFSTGEIIRPCTI